MQCVIYLYRSAGCRPFRMYEINKNCRENTWQWKMTCNSIVQQIVALYRKAGFNATNRFTSFWTGFLKQAGHADFRTGFLKHSAEADFNSCFLKRLLKRIPEKAVNGVFERDRGTDPDLSEDSMESSSIPL